MQDDNKSPRRQFLKKAVIIGSLGDDRMHNLFIDQGVKIFNIHSEHPGSELNKFFIPAWPTYKTDKWGFISAEQQAIDIALLRLKNQHKLLSPSITDLTAIGTLALHNVLAKNNYDGAYFLKTTRISKSNWFNHQLQKEFTAINKSIYGDLDVIFKHISGIKSEPHPWATFYQLRKHDLQLETIHFWAGKGNYTDNIMFGNYRIGYDPYKPANNETSIGVYQYHDGIISYAEKHQGVYKATDKPIRETLYEYIQSITRESPKKQFIKKRK